MTESNFTVRVEKMVRNASKALEGVGAILDNVFDGDFDNLAGRFATDLSQGTPGFKVSKRTEGFQGVVIEVEVPGSKKEEVHVQAGGGLLTVSWKARMDGDPKSLDFKIGTVADVDAITAKVEDGYATIMVPARKAKPDPVKKVRVE